MPVNVDPVCTFESVVAAQLEKIQTRINSASNQTIINLMPF